MSSATHGALDHEVDLPVVDKEPTVVALHAAFLANQM